MYERDDDFEGGEVIPGSIFLFIYYLLQKKLLIFPQPAQQPR